MGGFFSMEQNVRRNNGPNLEKGEGGYAPRMNTGANTRRNNGNKSRRNNASSVASDPRELEEVVVTEPPPAPPNTHVNVNRQPNNNGRISVVATNVQAPLPPNTTPEGEEQVGGRRRKSRRSKKRSKRSRRNRA